jgi:hypothetical protein
MARRTILPALKRCMALGIAAVAALPHHAQAGDSLESFCAAWTAQTLEQAAENKAVECLPDINNSYADNFNTCMDLGRELMTLRMKALDDRLAECRLEIAKKTGEAVQKPGSRVSDTLKQQGGPAPPPAAPTATVTEDVDVYDKPGGNGNVTGVLTAPNTVELAGACQKENWCNVLGPAVPGGNGWVWGALQF